jgi:DNA polymerase-3 subunit delta
MAKTLHAIDYLAAPDKTPARPVCVVFGDEVFLKRQILLRLRQEVLGDEGDLSFSAFEGSSAVLRDVLANLSVLAMFGRGQRLAVVEEADDFVSRYRAELEDYVAKPKSSGVLVLDVKSWPSNTRLYKAVAAEGLTIDCSAPTATVLTRWLGAWAKQTHRIQLAAAAADTLVEMVGPELGLLDQELAKLALATGPGGNVTSEMIQELVGSWRTKTAWDMLDAALDGKPSDALVQLDRLLLAGENPVAILGQISASLRRFAAATQLILQAEATGRRISLRDVLGQTGIKPYFLAKSESQLRRLGRQRGAQLYDWLLEADLDLKGDSQLPMRTVLEQLLLRLAAPVSSPSQSPQRRPAH